MCFAVDKNKEMCDSFSGISNVCVCVCVCVCVHVTCSGKL